MKVLNYSTYGHTIILLEKKLTAHKICSIYTYLYSANDDVEKNVILDMSAVLCIDNYAIEELRNLVLAFSKPEHPLVVISASTQIVSVLHEFEDEISHYKDLKDYVMHNPQIFSKLTVKSKYML